MSLEPCPFCGSNDLEYIFFGSQGNIHCHGCGAIRPDDPKAADPDCDVNAAYEAWNRRTGP